MHLKQMKENDYRLDNLMDGLHLAINSSAVTEDGATTITNDAPTVDETISDTASEISSWSGCDEGDHGGNDSNDDEISSTQSDHSNTSARILLKQAQLRLQQQSMCEEVYLLRAEVAQFKHSLESALRQKLQVKDRCNTLESQLDQANKTIHNYKLKEQKWNEEMSQREKDFMNQINDLCSEVKAKERYLMDEIIQRDKKIVEIQNRLNEKDIAKIESSSAKIEKNDVVAISMESKEMVEIDMDDDSWCDDSSCHFI
jgi:hypothetical protein